MQSTENDWAGPLGPIAGREKMDSNNEIVDQDMDHADPKTSDDQSVDHVDMKTSGDDHDNNPEEDNGTARMRKWLDNSTTRPHKCETCGRLFQGDFRLKQHLKICGTSFVCGNCEKVFKRSNYKTNLSFIQTTGRHRKKCPQMRIRAVKKPYHCEICGKMVGMYVRLLQRHMKSCSAPRVCHTCEKIFRSEWCMKRHRCPGNSNMGMEKVIDMVEVVHD